MKFTPIGGHCIISAHDAEEANAVDTVSDSVRVSVEVVKHLSSAATEENPRKGMERWLDKEAYAKP